MISSIIFGTISSFLIIAPAKSITAIVGSSGEGKTTILKTYIKILGC